MSDAETASARISERIAELDDWCGQTKRIGAARGTAAQPDFDLSDRAE